MFFIGCVVTWHRKPTEETDGWFITVSLLFFKGMEVLNGSGSNRTPLLPNWIWAIRATQKTNALQPIKMHRVTENQHTRRDKKGHFASPLEINRYGPILQIRPVWGGGWTHWIIYWTFSDERLLLLFQCDPIGNFWRAEKILFYTFRELLIGEPNRCTHIKSTANYKKARIYWRIDQ